jgi:nicotinate-nucleotide adenylyltransferase
MAGLVGVLGGTFDPPHIGHLVLADVGKWALNLEKVLWVVTAQPPHKPDAPISSIEDRIAMVEMAIGDDPAFELSHADIDRPGPHYAIDTVRWLTERYHGVDFVYLMGADSLMDLPRWHDPMGFLEICGVLGVMRRPGVEVDMQELELELPGVTGKATFFDAPLIGVSGQGIRRRVRNQEPFRYLLPQGIVEFIEEKSLYR